LNILEYGLELAIAFFKTTFQNIQNMIDMNQIVCAGPFLQVFFEVNFEIKLKNFFLKKKFFPKLAKWQQ
jgi:hypothetical protein